MQAPPAFTPGTFVPLPILSFPVDRRTGAFERFHLAEQIERLGRDLRPDRTVNRNPLRAHGGHPMSCTGRPTDGLTGSKFNPSLTKVRTTKARFASSCFSAG